MSYFAIPIFVMTMILVVLGTFVLQGKKTLRIDRMSLSQLEEDLDASQQSITEHQAILAERQGDLEPTRNFLEQWEDAGIGTQTAAQVLSSLDNAASRTSVATSNKTTGEQKKYLLNGYYLDCDTVGVRVTGDYPRIFNWLGIVEEAYPIGRVSRLVITQSGETGSIVAMDMAMQFPKMETISDDE